MQLISSIIVLIFLFAFTTNAQDKTLIRESIAANFDLTAVEIDSLIVKISRQNQQFNNLNEIEIKNPQRRASIIKKMRAENKKELSKIVGGIKNYMKLQNVLKKHSQLQANVMDSKAIDLKRIVDDYLFVNVFEILIKQKKYFNGLITNEQKSKIANVVAESLEYRSLLTAKRIACDSLIGAPKFQCRKQLNEFKENKPAYFVKLVSIEYKLNGKITDAIKPLSAKESTWKKEIQNLYLSIYPNANKQAAKKYAEKQLQITKPRGFLMLDIEKMADYKSKSKIEDNFTINPKGVDYVLTLELTKPSKTNIIAYFSDGSSHTILKKPLKTGVYNLKLDYEVFTDKLCVFKVSTSVGDKYLKTFLSFK